MANHPSAEKRHRQSVKRAERNRVQRSRIRTSVKQAREAIGGGDSAVAVAAAARAARDLDKAASKGIIHRNNAARRKARLARQAARVAKA